MSYLTYQLLISLQQLLCILKQQRVGNQCEGKFIPQVPVKFSSHYCRLVAAHLLLNVCRIDYPETIITWQTKETTIFIILIYENEFKFK